MRVAAIDIGSNSIHLVVASVDPDGHVRVLDRAKETARLGHRTLTTGRLSAEAMARGIRALANFRRIAERHGVTRFRAIATSAVREARNGGEFVQRVKNEVGLRVRVIPGREEARLIFLGVRQAMDLRQGPTLILDVGGGSVEIILAEGDRPSSLSSVKLGVGRLSERFLRSDPPRPSDLRALQQHVRDELNPVLDAAAARGVRRVVGTSGTLLNLVAVAAHHRGEDPKGGIHGVAVGAEEVSRVRRLLTHNDREGRLRIRGLDAKRVDQIVAGAYLAEHVMGRLHAETLVACTWAIREGLLHDFALRHGPGIEETARFADVRRRSVMRLLRHLGQAGSHPEHVARLALRLFDQLRDPLALPDVAREWLEYAAFLHDVGHLIDHEHHHRHSYYLIVHGDLFGFTREEVEILARTASHHDRKGEPRYGSVTLPAATRRTIRALSAILRLAEGLDRSHYGIVQDVKVRKRGAGTSLELRTDGEDAALEIWEADRRTGLLEKLLGRPVRVRLANRG